MPKNPFHEFCKRERQHYAGFDNGRFASAISQPSRYYDFLLVVHRRYQRVAKEYSRNIQELKDGQSAAWERSYSLTTRLHLEIESFYVFSKTLLDKLAWFIQFYFGEAPGCSLASHHKFSKDAEKYATKKDLQYPQGFTEQQKTLLESVVHYRNKAITHLKNSRAMFGTTLAGGEVSGIFVGYSYPTEQEMEKRPVESAVPNDMLQSLTSYVHAVFQLIRENRDKTRLARTHANPSGTANP